MLLKKQELAILQWRARILAVRLVIDWKSRSVTRRTLRYNNDLSDFDVTLQPAPAHHFPLAVKQRAKTAEEL